MEQKMSKKKGFIIAISAILILIGVIVIFGLLNKKSYNFPISGLSPVQDTHQYRKFNGLVESVNVENLFIDVPENNIPTNAPAYLYNLGNETILCITESQSLNEPKAVVLDTLKGIDTSQKSVSIVKTEEGFLNGFKWTYICATTKEYAVIIYKTPVSELYNMVLAAVIHHPTDEFIRQGVVILQGVIGTVSQLGENKEPETTQIKGNHYLEEYDDFQKLYDNEISHMKDAYYTQQYYQYVTAERDYEHMRLTVNWIDTHVVPRQLILYDRNEELEYSPVEMEEGKYVFIVDNVKYGEIFPIYFDMENPGAIAFQQEEEADYEAYMGRDESEYADFTGGGDTTTDEAESVEESEGVITE